MSIKSKTQQPGVFAVTVGINYDDRQDLIEVITKPHRAVVDSVCDEVVGWAPFTHRVVANTSYSANREDSYDGLATLTPSMVDKLPHVPNAIMYRLHDHEELIQ